MAKKKVLVIIPDRFTHATGGMGTNSLPVFELLSDEFDFFVIAFPLQGTTVPTCITQYKEVWSPYTETNYWPLNTLLAQARYFAEAITLPKPDVVYAYDWSIYQAAEETARFFDVPLVARMSLSAILLAQGGYTFKLDLSVQAEQALHNALCEMEVRGLKAAERVVHISSAYAAQYETIMPLAEKSRLVANGIDLALWQAATPPHQLPGGEGRQKVVFLGRLVEIKGVLALCAAKIPKEIDLIFVGPQETGDPACMQAIEQKVSQESNVFYMGALYGQVKMQALKSADALIVPSLHEPFGTVGLEGLAAGCTVLSSRAGGLADYLTDDTSIFCGIEARIIETALQTWLELSPEARATMREAGFAACRKFSLDSTAKQLRSVFLEVL